MSITNALQRTFGCEVELALYTEDARQALSSLYPTGAHWEHHEFATPDGVWEVKGDGSVTHDDDGREITTPPLRWGTDRLAALLAALVDAGGEVTETTGGHVHIGIEDYTEDDLAALISLAVEWEEIIYAAFSPWGSRSDYCTPIACDMLRFALEEGVALRESDTRRWLRRYCGLNPLPWLYDDHPTVEFRLFNGSLDSDHWHARILFALALVQAGKERIAATPGPGAGMGDLLALLGITAEAFPAEHHCLRNGVAGVCPSSW